MTRLNGWAAEANAKTILTRLGISGFDARVSTLSGGMRKRVALARALLGMEHDSESTVTSLLILDEPTNHVDADTIDWLEQYLLGGSGALLMVTHDRYFLDRVVNRIVELDRRQLVNYPGNYTRYLEQVGRAPGAAGQGGRGSAAAAQAGAGMDAPQPDGARHEAKGPHPARRRATAASLRQPAGSRRHLSSRAAPGQEGAGRRAA